MPFPLDVRSPLQAGDDLYPEMATFEAGLPVVLDDSDGAVRDLTATSLTVRGQEKGHVRVAASSRRGADILVTDARVVLVSERREGRLVAGHIRHEWLVAVGGSDGRGFRAGELRLVLQHASGEYAVVTLSFDRTVDVHEVAQDIIRRAARHWLAARLADPMTPDWQARSWEALLDAPKLTAPQGEFALHFAPSYERVETAPLGRPFAATA